MELKIKQKTILVEAQIWRRVVAFLIDILILDTFVLFPFNKIAEKLLGSISYVDVFNVAKSGGIDFSKLIYFSTSICIIILLYFVLFEVFFSQTIGKMVMRIYVVNSSYNLHSKNAKISIWQGFLRSLGIIFMISLTIVPILDIAYSLFNPANQRLFEKFSNTRTVSFTLI